MKLTLALRSPPIFHFWKDFGAGRKKRIPYYKYWWTIWRRVIQRSGVVDHTLPKNHLPPGSRLMDAEDFMVGDIDALPDEILKQKYETTIYDHPWPFNVNIDPVKNQPLMYSYEINTRFYMPRVDCQALTNTIISTEKLEAQPVFEPDDKHLEQTQRRYDWLTVDDSVLIRLPKKRQYPRIDQVPCAKYGATVERQETGVLNGLSDVSLSFLAQHYKTTGNREKYIELISRRSVAFPHCQVPLNRQDKNLYMDLCIDSMSVCSEPLPVIDKEPERTRELEPISIEPRSWKSVLEQTRSYSPDWTFTMPRNTYPHTIQIAARIKRLHLNPDEMLARSIVHAFGLAFQFARFKAYEKARKLDGRTDQASLILEKPLEIDALYQSQNLVEKPIVTQAIAFDKENNQFHFLRYQLNTTQFDDSNSGRIKNQAWYSGPVSDLREVLRFYLDFQSFHPQVDQSMREEALGSSA